MHFQSLLYIIFISMTLGLWSRARADLFAAVADIEPLLDTHKKSIDDFNDYIVKEEKRLDILKKHLIRYKKEHDLAMQNIKDYLENPINAFTLIKRLTTDLEFLRKNIVISKFSNDVFLHHWAHVRAALPNDYIANVTVNDPNLIYPTLEDLTEAVLALARLQKTYKLDIGELSEGRLNSGISRGNKNGAISLPMTASDCFELGRILYNEMNYRNSLYWMMEALRKFKTEDNISNVTEGDALEYISYLHNLLGDIPTALEWTKKLLVLDPEHINANYNAKKYQKTIEEEELKKQQKEENGHNENEDEKPSDVADLIEDEDITTYEALCRGDIEISSKIKKNLKCTYLTENHPYLKLAPIKREQIYIAPDVFLFYDVMSDGEIEHIRNMAKPRIARAQVNNGSTSITSSYRISKCAWLTDEESEVVSRVTRRTADFTGLSMDSAEQLQVANYGIGGHYEPHYDHEEEFSTTQRIATVLFYMSDVAQGGATVFTKLGLTVFPVKNSALFWMNLHHSGVGNNATRHAACPVLQGSKWASNKWIQVLGQELIKPCGLTF